MEKISFQNVNRIVILIIIMLGLFGGYLLLQKITFLKSIPLTDQRWGTFPPLIATFLAENDKSELNIHRLSDGAREQLTGTWEFSFFSPNEGAIFGYFAEKLTEQRLYIVRASGSTQIDISQLPGPIINVQQNPVGTYLMINGIRSQPLDKKNTSSNSTYSCVMEKKPPFGTKIAPCIDVLRLVDKQKKTKQDADYFAHWHNGKDRELAIIEGKDPVSRIFTFDPWEDHVALVANVNAYMEELDTAGVSARKEYPNQTYQLNRFWRLLTIEKANKPKKFIFLPSDAPMQWVSQWHVAIFDSKKVYLVNVESSEVSEMESFEKGSRIFTFYPPINDETFIE